MQGEEEAMEPNYTPEEHSHWKQKEGRPVTKALKEPHPGAFSKESEITRMATWAYYKTYQPNCKQDGSDGLSWMFQHMGNLC